MVNVLSEDYITMAEAKGLRQQTTDWETVRTNSQDEQEYLKPLVYNRLVEQAIVTQRQEALRARVRQLEESLGETAGSR